MPRYYCDYCDTHLTHDSPSVRKQHNAGYKHKANVREYYQQFEQLQTQSLIDQKIKERMGQAGAMYQIGIGAPFNQHLASLPGMQRPRLPILPPPALPIPGAPAQLPPGFRPPVLPRPGFPGYGMPPQMAPIPGQPQMTSTLPMQMNGMMPRPLPPPPPMSGPEGGTTNPTSSGAPPPGVAQPMYQQQQQPNPTGGAPPTSAPTDSYVYAPPAPPGSAH